MGDRRKNPSRPESRRLLNSCMALAFAVALVLFVFDTISRVELVEKISSVRLMDSPPGTFPVAEGTREEHLLLPGSSMDARWWVLHTEQMLQRQDWRVRFTELDNYPNGREVHWSSLLMWALAAVAWILSLGTGRPAVEFVAEAAVWVGPVLLVVFLGGFSALVIRRFGWLAGTFFATVVLTSFPVTRMFQAGEADHHGLVICFAAAAVFSLFAGGLGFAMDHPKNSPPNPAGPPATRSVRWWFVVSGVFAACGLWISAATMIPVLVGTGIGVLVSTFLARKCGARVTHHPELWTLWGFVGCCASLGFYLLEYFPGHLGLRLEVNHPVFAMGFFGAGILLSVFTRWIVSPSARKLPGALVWKLFAGLTLSGVPVLAFLVFHERAFWVADGFLLALHERYIFEFQSVATVFRAFDGNWVVLTYYPWPFFGLLGMVVVVWWCRAKPWVVAGILFLFSPVLVMQVLAVLQVRWASAAFLLWALLALAVFLLGLSEKNMLGAVLRWGGVFFAWLAIFITQLPQVLAAVEETGTALQAPIRQQTGHGIVLKDIAHRLLHSSPGSPPVVLTGPNASTDLAYHGKIRVVGTLYWENMPGLKRAAEIFSLREETEVLEALQSAGVTHLLVPSWDDFTSAYEGLWKAEDPALADSEGSGYLQNIFQGAELPQWLRPFAYPIPSASGIDATSVKIFAVLPEQNQFEANFFQGVFWHESGDFQKALDFFLKAKSLRPADPKTLGYLEETRRIIEETGAKESE